MFPLGLAHLTHLYKSSQLRYKNTKCYIHSDVDGVIVKHAVHGWMHDNDTQGFPTRWSLHMAASVLCSSVCDVFVCLLSHGGGTCFYINERWCTDVTVLKKMCCSDLETFFINSRPVYSPREICSFILVSVYIPPQANVSSALQKLADLITDTEQKHPDSVLIILEDFN